MKTYVYLIRHGEVYNPEGILYGRMPHFHLSEKGKRELLETAKFLKDKKIAAVYASPATRTRESATIITEHLGIDPYVVAKRVWEIRTSFQGRKFSELSPDQSEVYNSSKRLRTDEDVEKIARRMMNFIQDMAHNHKGKRIVIVSHGDPIMSAKAAIKNLPFDFPSIRVKPYVQHGEVTEITIDGNDIEMKTVFIPKVT